jgi:cysteinyl-tRNA synthetase
MVQQILDNGFAYVSNGSVYFDVAAYNRDYGYGKLSGRDLENMMAESRTDLEGVGEKRNPADFALWKKAGPTHIMRWNSPWGVGFPGWHIECTAMSTKYLGKQYDIHGGGMDLLFPHHEAEIAQSNACNHGQPDARPDEARYWLHNNMITYEGQKMGKSLGNAIGLREFFSGFHRLLEQPYAPMTIRYFMLTAHYRSTLDFSNQALQASEKAFRRMTDTLKRLETLDPDAKPVAVDPEFEQNLSTFMQDVRGYMNDDFNTAKVIARMFDALGVVNQLYKTDTATFGVNPATFEAFRTDFKTVFSEWLGLIADNEEGARNNQVVDGLMKLVIDVRADARKTKNWAVADQIRQQLTSLGIKLEDTAQGTDWYYES